MFSNYKSCRWRRTPLFKLLFLFCLALTLHQSTKTGLVQGRTFRKLLKHMNQAGPLEDLETGLDFQKSTGARGAFGKDLLPQRLFVDYNDCKIIYPIYNASGLTCEETFQSYDNADQMIQDCYGCRYYYVQLLINSFLASTNKELFYMEIILSQISSLFLTAVGFFILLNKKFSKHPYPLLALALIFQAMVFQGQYLMYFVLPMKMPQFVAIYMQIVQLLDFNNFQANWSYLTQMRVMDLNTFDQRRLFQIVEVFILSWKGIFYMGTLLQISLNSMLFIDLRLALKNPFYPRRKRQKYYNMAIFGVLMYILLVMTTSSSKQSTSLNLIDYLSDSIFFVLGPKSFYIFIIIFIGIPFTLMVSVLTREGTSKDLRKKIVKYQVVYFAFYFINLISCTYDLWDIQFTWFKQDELSNHISVEIALYIIEILFCIVGVPMAIIRLLEPYVWREFLYQSCLFGENLLKCVTKSLLFCRQKCRKGNQGAKKSQRRDTGQSKDTDERSFEFQLKKTHQLMRKRTETRNIKRKRSYDYSQDTLYSFVNSAMNIEMVYLILLGISNFMENTTYNQVAQEQIENSIRLNQQEQSQSTIIDNKLKGFGSIKQMPTSGDFKDYRLGEKFSYKKNKKYSDVSENVKKDKHKKNKNVKKIGIKKDQNETKITFHNVKFQNVDLWDIENRSVSFAIGDNNYESTNKLQKNSIIQNSVRIDTEHNGFVFHVYNDDKNQSKVIANSKINPTKFDVKQKHPHTQVDYLQQQTAIFRNKDSSTDNSEIKMDRFFSDNNFDEEDTPRQEIIPKKYTLGGQFEYSQNNNQSSLLSSMVKRPTFMKSIDQYGSSMQIITPAIETESHHSTLMVLEKNNDNHTVSIRYQRNNPQSAFLARKKEQDKAIKNQIHSALIHQQQPLKSGNTQTQPKERTKSSDSLQSLFTKIKSGNNISNQSGLNVGPNQMCPSESECEKPKVEMMSTTTGTNPTTFQNFRGGDILPPKPTNNKIPNNELSMKVKASIKSYEDAKFAQIMFMDNIKPEDVIKSLSLEKNRNMVFRAGEGVGQSGSFFFFSHDNRFIIKTLRGKEKKNILDMLDDYIEHIKFTENKSLLARIYGVFTITTNYFTPLDIIIMQNTSQLSDKHHKKMTFDLKGSTHGRMSGLPPDEQKFWRRNDFNTKKVLKDLNYLEINRDLSGQLMKLSRQQFEEIEITLKADSIFLAKHNLMDYSLLLVIEECPVEEDQINLGKQIFSKEQLSVIQEANDGPEEDIKKSLSNVNSTIQVRQELENTLENSQEQSVDNKLGNTSIAATRALDTHQKQESIMNPGSILSNNIPNNMNKILENAQIRNQFKSVMRDQKDTTLLSRMSFSTILSNRDTFRSSIPLIRQSQKQGSVTPSQTRRTVPKPYFNNLLGNSTRNGSEFIPSKNKKKQQVLDNASKVKNTRESQLRKVPTKQYYQIYHVAIIDYLQEWSINKRFENKIKVFYDTKNRDRISAVHPKRYQERFCEFITRNVTKPAYENFKTNVGYVEACENFIESMIALLRVYELQNAGLVVQSSLRQSNVFQTPRGILPTDVLFSSGNDIDEDCSNELALEISYNSKSESSKKFALNKSQKSTSQLLQSTNQLKNKLSFQNENPEHHQAQSIAQDDNQENK